MKKKGKKKRPIRLNSSLEVHNAKDFINDYNLIYVRFAHLSPSKQDWLFTTRESLQQKPTLGEKHMGKFLDKQKIQYISQAPFQINGKFYFLDFYLKDMNIAIEVDGYSHRGIENIERDRNRDFEFRSIGIRTIRITNEEVMNSQQLMNRVIEEKVIKDVNNQYYEGRKIIPRRQTI